MSRRPPKVQRIGILDSQYGTAQVDRDTTSVWLTVYDNQDTAVLKLTLSLAYRLSDLLKDAAAASMQPSTRSKLTLLGGAANAAPKKEPVPTEEELSASSLLRFNKLRDGGVPPDRAANLAVSGQSEDPDRG